VTELNAFVRFVVSNLDIEEILLMALDEIELYRRQLLMNVRVVEIAPIFHKFARGCFGLPRLNVFYEDGRAFVKTAL
jgi:hypothetical protein